MTPNFERSELISNEKIAQGDLYKMKIPRDKGPTAGQLSAGNY